jgi:hypothetical protein
MMLDSSWDEDIDVGLHEWDEERDVAGLGPRL